jgi:hypothetical protein
MTDSAHGRRSASSEPVDPRNPGDAYLQNEIDTNRRDEYRLIGKALIALLFVAVLVAIRVVFFQ